MSKIRHLEYYGYADQNVYSPVSSPDMSSVKKENIEQDKAINTLVNTSSANFDLVKDISGNVNTFIAKQDALDKMFNNTVTSTNGRLSSIESTNGVMCNTINKLIDSQELLEEQINAMKIHHHHHPGHDCSEELRKHIDDAHRHFGHIDRRMEDLADALHHKMSEEDAKYWFADKKETYTKNDVDKLVDESIKESEKDVKTWVEDKGYVSSSDMSENYISKLEMAGIKNDIIVTVKDSAGKVIDEKFKEYLNSVNSRITACNTRIDTFTKKLENLEKNINARIDAIENKTNAFNVDEDNNIHLSVGGKKVCLNDLLKKLLD